MKLPKLPSLKKKRDAHRSSNLRSIDSKATKMKPMPGGDGSSKRSAVIPVWSAVDKQKDGWGGEVWFEVDGWANEKAAVGGTCATCGGAVRAIDLKLRRKKDGTEVWVCQWCR